MKLSQNKKIWIKGLVMECPAGIPTSDCPLNVLRSLPIMQANRIINQMSDQQVSDYLRTHSSCYHHRITEN